MKKQDYKMFMDIGDLKLSAQLLALCANQLEMMADLEALTSLVAMKYDSYAIDAAKHAVRKQRGYTDSVEELCECMEAIKVAQDDPQARLRAAFKAKLEGRY